MKSVAVVSTLFDAAPPTEAELISHCHSRYSRFKSPSRIEFVARLPKSLIGKVLKQELRRSIQGREP